MTEIIPNTPFFSQIMPRINFLELKWEKKVNRFVFSIVLNNLGYFPIVSIIWKIFHQHRLSFQATIVYRNDQFVATFHKVMKQEIFRIFSHFFYLDMGAGMLFKCSMSSYGDSIKNKKVIKRKRTKSHQNLKFLAK